MWTLSLPAGALHPASVQRLLALAEAAGLSPHRPDGRINGFSDSGDHRLLDRQELVHGLATGSWSTNLWGRTEVEVHLSAGPGRVGAGELVHLSLDVSEYRRVLREQAQPFQDPHRLLTDLWVALAGALGARFGRVEEEWSVEQIWSELEDPLREAPPPPGSWPEWLSWSTYFDADLYPLLPPLAADLGADVHRTPDGGAVIALLPDPTAVDVLKFADLHHEYRRAVDEAAGG